MYYNLDYTLLNFDFRRTKDDCYYDLESIRFVLLEDSCIVFNKDGTFNRLKISENVFVSISKIELKRKLVEKVGLNYTVIESGQNVYIGRDLPNEFLYSRSSQSLNGNMKMIKYKLINYLEDLINYSENRYYEPNYKEKHKLDAKYGFYKYTVNFSVVNNSLEDFYKCIVLIRNDADGKKYLYDILGIKKIDLLAT